MKNKKVLAFLLLLIFPAVSAHAYWVWSPEQGKFVNAEGASQDTAQDDYDYAMKFYREKNLDEAEKRFEDILKKYPQSKTAPEAQYRLGLVLEEKGDYLKSFKSYKRLVESYPQSERFNEVIEREFRIGNVFLSGKKAKFAGLEILPSLPKAVEVFQHIVKSAPYSDFGDKAQFQLGLAFKKWHHFGDAVEAFQAVIDQYPKSELVSQARYELAETSFLKSAANVRDQRSLDDASKQVDRFLDRYPDASTAEKAAAIRQEIDEKNAEKNYRIGLYYEKDNYIESALIYYSDVATRYPSTHWGQKAAEKLRSLKEPVKFVAEQEAVFEEQEHSLQNKLKMLDPKKDAVDYDITKRSLERLEKHRKTLDKDKKESMQHRKDDLKRRESELKQKFKNLDQKKKLLAKNQSEDLKNAIDRWNASLISEQESLAKERQQLEGWQEELGIHDRKIDMSFLPFVGQEPSEIQKVQLIDSKKFFKLSEQKKSILEEKETLYKHHGEVSALLRQGGGDLAPLPVKMDGAESEKLKKIQDEISRLESELHEKTNLYEKRYGKSMLSAIAGGVRKSWDKSLDILNPFDNTKSGELGEQQLLERQMHLKEQIAAQEALIQTLSQALDAQIALQEQKRLMADLGVKEKMDPNQLRKSVRDLERKIRGGYEEIEERDKNKKKFLQELDQELKRREKQDGFMLRVTREAVSPVAGTAKMVKAFFVGLPHQDVELTNTASQLANTPDTARIKQLEEEIKSESLLMEAKNREINNQRKELEILKAQAALAGGYKFRSVFIDVPYLFFNEAMDGARRIVPKKNREALLINRMNEETKKSEKLKNDLKELDAQIEKVAPGVSAKETPKTEPEISKKASVTSPSAEVLKNEIETIQRQLQMQQMVLIQEKEALQSASSPSDKKSEAAKTPVLSKKQSKKLTKELHEIEQDLQKVIRKENELEGEESQILTKRISHIDKSMKKVHSKAVTQDLVTEKERMEERLSQLESRKDFLSQELKRFEPVNESANPRS